ncbi:MAG: hypothetical protein KGJ38_08190, partial [Burkholderiaceae bacterium]|nr:hypothetical protein [Burkholderiaceae bacterium]
MSKITVTLEFSSIAEMLETFAATPVLAASQGVRIAPEDRPDAGRDGGFGGPAHLLEDARQALAELGTPLAHAVSFGQQPVPAATEAAPTAPLAPPAPTVPTPPTAAAAPAAAPGVELDKNGLPWDPRIHAGTKTKNADGSWRALRGVDEAVKASVEADIRRLMALNTGAPAA